MDDEVDPAPAEGKGDMGEAGVGTGEDVMIRVGCIDASPSYVPMALVKLQ